MRHQDHLLGRRLGAAILILGGIGACSSGGGGGHTLTTNTAMGAQPALTGGGTSSGGTATGASGSSTTGGTATGGTTAVGGTTATGGTTTGGASTGGAPTGGSGVGGAATGGDAGAGGGATGGAGGTGAANPGFTGPFECTLVAGLLVTGEWYNAGFENDGVDGDKWEGKFVHYGYIDIWSKDSADGGFTWDGAISSPCTAKSLEPDRVIFTAMSWELAYMKDVYVMDTAEAVRKFKQNYPSMKRMDLMTIVRCPGDEVTNVTGQMCNANAAIPPIAGTTDHNAGQQDCYINAEIDQALDEVAAMPEFAGLVYVGKKFYSPACRQPVDGAHLGDNNNQVAQAIADYYKDGAP